MFCVFFARTGRPGRELDDGTAQGRGFEPGRRARARDDDDDDDDDDDAAAAAAAAAAARLPARTLDRPLPIR